MGATFTQLMMEDVWLELENYLISKVSKLVPKTEVYKVVNKIKGFYAPRITNNFNTLVVLIEVRFLNGNVEFYDYEELKEYIQKNHCDLIGNSLFIEGELVAKLGTPTYMNTKTINFSVIPRMYPTVKLHVNEGGDVIYG